MLKRAIFLDRDGVINRVIIKDGKPYSPRTLSDFQFTPGIERFLSVLKDAGYIIVVVTNQPDLTRGRVTSAELDGIHALIGRSLPVDDIIVCPHDDEDGCDCRKPKPGMIVQAAEKWGIDIGSSFIIGDTWKDMEAGQKAGCTSILLDAPYNQEVNGNHRIKDISEALKIILPAHPR